MRNDGALLFSSHFYGHPGHSGEGQARMQGQHSSLFSLIQWNVKRGRQTFTGRKGKERLMVCERKNNNTIVEQDEAGFWKRWRKEKKLQVWIKNVKMYTVKIKTEALLDKTLWSNNAKKSFNNRKRSKPLNKWQFYYRHIFRSMWFKSISSLFYHVSGPQQCFIRNKFWLMKFPKAFYHPAVDALYFFQYFFLFCRETCVSSWEMNQWSIL